MNATYANVWVVDYSASAANYTTHVILNQLNGTLEKAYDTNP